MIKDILKLTAIMGLGCAVLTGVIAGLYLGALYVVATISISFPAIQPYLMELGTVFYAFLVLFIVATVIAIADRNYVARNTKRGQNETR